MTNMSEFLNTSHTTGGNSSYLENLFEAYISNPSDIPDDWRLYFDSLPNNEYSQKDISHAEIIERFKHQRRSRTNPDLTHPINEKQIRVIQLIQAYRNRGHQKANIDPLRLQQRGNCEELDLQYHGLNKDDLDKIFHTDTLNINQENASLKEIMESLEKIYCNTLGIEYNYITNHQERSWFQSRLEPKIGNINFSNDEKIYILKRLGAAEGLAKFLASRYPGMKRFGIEGAESLIPLLDSLIQNCGIFGAQQICFGMAHRGRLNVLVNVLGKSPKELFSEFEEDYELTGDNTGDVKYHLGFSSNILTPNGEVHVSLNSNPSHLEIVNPVIEGSVRARQDRLDDQDRNLVVPILIHGDASFSGQGVVMETLQMSQTRGYGVGGTVHVIINNQIGFTTSMKEDARSTDYATDVAKMIEAPILHVNSDDPEMVVFTAKLASEYRYTFKKDIVIDMVCFRRRGHNEADDPAITQPMMYQTIAKHPGIKNIYQNQLIKSGVINIQDCEALEKKYRSTIEEGSSVAHNLALEPNASLWFDWTPYMDNQWFDFKDTAVEVKKFQQLGKVISSIPDGFELQRPVQKIFENRFNMSKGTSTIDWGFAEIMAYATLLSEGYPIRLTGQDVRRGTFSHRHAVIHNKLDGEGHMPLLKIANDSNTRLDIYDSLLSEEAVLGFEYGYSSTWPSGLTIWEAQFGDFANGAQVVIDQFIVSAEHKWQRLSGLVLLLPHGYEGQGPEHSSARLERFLQLCAYENIQVVVPSNPAQIFHLLRQQCKRNLRKPLIIFTPKSLLRHPEAVSNLSEFTSGEYQLVISDGVDVNPDISRVILCSGKIYYDLNSKKLETNNLNVALNRIEQLYPFPYKELEEILLLYPNATEIFWCQEEPANQGAWFSHRHRLQRVLDKTHNINAQLLSRPASSAPAVGLNKLHIEQQNTLINSAFKISEQ